MKRKISNLRSQFRSLMFLFSFLLMAPSAFAVTCTTVSVCDYYTAYCVSNTAHDPAFPKTINTMKFDYTMTDPSPVSSCTGNNGRVDCHGGTTSFSITTLPAPAGSCTFTPDNSLPTSVDCRYNTKYCTTTCSASHPVTTCI